MKFGGFIRIDKISFDLWFHGDVACSDALETYTPRQIADILAVNLRNVYTPLKTTDAFRILQLGRIVRIHKDSFDHWFLVFMERSSFLMASIVKRDNICAKIAVMSMAHPSMRRAQGFIFRAGAFLTFALFVAHPAGLPPTLPRSFAYSGRFAGLCDAWKHRQYHTRTFAIAHLTDGAAF